MHRTRTVDITALPAQRTARATGAHPFADRLPVVLDLDLLPVIDVPPAPAPHRLEVVHTPELEAVPLLRARRRASRPALHRRRSVQLATTAVLALAVGAGGGTVLERGRTAEARQQAAGAEQQLREATALAATQVADAEAGATAAAAAQERAEASRTALDADLTATMARLDAVQAELDALAETRARPTPSASASASATIPPPTARASSSASAAAPAASTAVPAATTAPAPAAGPAADDGDGVMTSYDTCADARAAGAAPVRAGDPGYGSHLDRDGDGVGCE